MKSFPDNWRVHDGRDPEKEARRLKKRFQGISRRYERTMALRRHSRWLKICIGAALLAFALTWSLMGLSSWPPLTTLKHLAAFTNCDMAHALGVAPVYRGQPGYWERHDEDGNGRTCE
jgi:hypothetical protein